MNHQQFLDLEEDERERLAEAMTEEERDALGISERGDPSFAAMNRHMARSPVPIPVLTEWSHEEFAEALENQAKNKTPLRSRKEDWAQTMHDGFLAENFIFDVLSESEWLRDNVEDVSADEYDNSLEIFIEVGEVATFGPIPEGLKELVWSMGFLRLFINFQHDQGSTAMCRKEDNMGRKFGGQGHQLCATKPKETTTTND